MFWPEGLDEELAGCRRWLALLLAAALGFGLGALLYAGYGPSEPTPEPPAVWTTP